MIYSTLKSEKFQKKISAQFSRSIFYLEIEKKSYSLLILKLQLVIYTLAGTDIYEGREYWF